MSDSLKVLGQLHPAATTLSTLYTVPDLVQTTTSSLVVCNTSSGNTDFRVSIAVAGAADNIKQYIYYDQAISAKHSVVSIMGLTLNEGDVVRVYSGNGNISFSLFGVETLRD
jgi:hypothetical protein